MLFLQVTEFEILVTTVYSRFKNGLITGYENLKYWSLHSTDLKMNRLISLQLSVSVNLNHLINANQVGSRHGHGFHMMFFQFPAHMMRLSFTVFYLIRAQGDLLRSDLIS